MIEINKIKAKQKLKIPLTKEETAYLYAYNKILRRKKTNGK